jgi:hypothetical protein
MEKYAKIIDADSGICEVAEGNPDAVWRIVVDESGEQITLYARDFYESIGMSLMDIEKGYDGAWYIASKVPVPPPKKTIRTFSKFNVWVATRSIPIAEGSDLTVWQAFETFLHEQNLWTGWNQLVDLVEDNPFFEQFYPLACERLGKDLVDQVLAASVTSTKEVIG